MTTTEAQFQAERVSSLGGSDLANILGLDDAFGSPLSTYMEKVEGKFTEPTDAMEEGTALEPVIRAKYCRRTGLVVHPAPFQRHPEHPFVAGHPDGVAGWPDVPPDRMWEAKRVGSTKGWGEEGSDQVPKRVAAQVQHYLHVWNEIHPDNLLDFSDVTARDKMSMKERDYRVPYSREWCMDVMVPTLVSFWHDHIAPRVPPEPGVGEAKDRYPTTVANNYVEASDALVVKWDEYLDLIQVQAHVKERIAARRHEFEMAMGETGDHLVRPSDGVVLCTWKNGKPRTTIDTKALKAQYPEVYERLAKTSDKPTRTFLPKLTNNGGETTDD
jgi:predicted phage-related endonuclease